MLEFTEGMKKPAGKKRQVVCWCVGELNRLTAGLGKGQGKEGWAAWQGQGWKLGKGKKSSQLDSDHAASWCPKPGAAPSPLAPSLLVTRELGELPASPPFHPVLMAQSPASVQLLGSVQPSGAHYPRSQSPSKTHSPSQPSIFQEQGLSRCLRGGTRHPQEPAHPHLGSGS